MEIIGLIIAGLIIGLLGKFVAPGARDNTPLWLTLLCGIGGVLIGYYVSGALGVAATPGIDWTRWIISITHEPIGGSRIVRRLQRAALQRLVQRTVDAELDKVPAHVARVQT